MDMVVPFLEGQHSSPLGAFGAETPLKMESCRCVKEDAAKEKFLFCPPLTRSLFFFLLL